MDRQSMQNVARPIMRFACNGALCGCAVGALGGCGRTARSGRRRRGRRATQPRFSRRQANSAESDRPAAASSTRANRSPATAGERCDVDRRSLAFAVVRAAYPPAQEANGDDAPRVRLAQARPMPLPAEGPELDAPQRSLASRRRIKPRSFRCRRWLPLRRMPDRCRRNPELDAVARQADAQTAHGFELAQRGAIYSARAEFIAALHTIAAALDSANCGNNHDRMLAAGLEALDEADDFAAHGASAAGDADVARIVAGHQTPALKGASLTGLSCTAAMSRYLTFAQEQLAGCTAGIPAGSAALFGLGKIYRVPESMHGPADPTHGAKAVALLQAALLVDNRNYRAANELGVLLAKFGRLPEARAALLHSVEALAAADDVAKSVGRSSNAGRTRFGRAGRFGGDHRRRTIESNRRRGGPVVCRRAMARPGHVRRHDAVEHRRHAGHSIRPFNQHGSQSDQYNNAIDRRTTNPRDSPPAATRGCLKVSTCEVESQRP